VTAHPEYERLGATSSARQRAYRTLCAQPLPPDEMTNIRRSLHRGEVLGDATFRAHVTSRAGVVCFRQRHGGDRRSHAFRGADPA
jgi:hypothetical protein